MIANVSISLTLIICSLTVSSIAQTPKKKNDQNKETPREFKNQGEQEDYWAELLFKRDYKKERYDIYKGQVVISNNNVFQYDREIVNIYNISPKLKAIFEKGLFYPAIITAFSKYQRKLKITIPKDTVKPTMVIDTVAQKAFFKRTSSDSLKISDFEEVKFLEDTPKKRRFRFWLYTKSFANPAVYFMELTNKHATTETTIEMFISGAKVTFFQQGWIIM